MSSEQEDLGRELEARMSGDTLPFEDLDAPAPLPAEPPGYARWLAFAAILVGGLLGGMIGYGTAEIMTESGTWAGVGAIIGALIGAAGVGTVAGLTLRAMNEWRAIEHPEGGDAADRRPGDQLGGAR